MRYYIRDKKISFPTDWEKRIADWHRRAEEAKEKANISFEIREDTSDLSYCAMDDLAYLADNEKDKIKRATLLRDAIEYKPIRDALAHTSRLTAVAKKRLSMTYENIKARIISLLNQV